MLISWVKRWQYHCITGYLMALLLQAVAVGIMLLLMRPFPTLVSSGSLTILATLIVALGWGSGPSLFSILIGTGLFHYLILPPPFTWNLLDPQELAENRYLPASWRHH